MIMLRQMKIMVDETVLHTTGDGIDNENDNDMRQQRTRC